ncbi:sodium/potassium-transporting ATPase subunit beta-2 [Solenopsis invicta]|uniref:sodium/potassium-transporting ATPase subunit beta-2 n=1 Tax=Solenopsis invicta TaxID=13686 RepID=UPI00193D7462|nr:sodium/potassium-transporting ATPase subunit beta-2 [Solenopsis invicta]
MDYSFFAKIWQFFVIFYTVQSSYFDATHAVYQTLDPNAPNGQLDNLQNGSNPVVSFRPMPPESNVESTLIWYKASDKGSYLPWVRELDEFLEEYRNPPNTTSTYRSCDYDNLPPPGEPSVCVEDVSTWGKCTAENKYGFITSTPCIFLKLNKIVGWQPEFYNDTQNFSSLMPEDLKAHIKQKENANKLDTIWVSCKGENPADVENMGPIEYIPRRGFPGYYFPYNNTPGYQSPLVAVHFKRPMYGVLINIECRAWAHNIIHDRFEESGLVHFELMID